MHLRSLLLRNVPLLLTLSFASSCQTGIKWNPDFYAGDYQSESIVNEQGTQVFATEEKFNEFGCLHRDQIKELREILRRAKVPKEQYKPVSELIKRLK